MYLLCGFAFDYEIIDKTTFNEKYIPSSSPQNTTSKRQNPKLRKMIFDSRQFRSLLRAPPSVQRNSHLDPRGRHHEAPKGINARQAGFIPFQLGSALQSRRVAATELIRRRREKKREIARSRTGREICL